MSTPPATTFESIGGSSNRNILAVGWSGTVMHYDGNSWELLDSPTTGQLFDVWCRSDVECYISGSNGEILKYDGNSLVRSDNGITTDRLYGIWGTPQGEVFAVGYNGTILRKPPPVKGKPPKN
jgi:hypothetical protein